MANLSLNRVLDRAPYGSSAVALLEKDENGYRCSLDVYSKYGPLMASAVRSTTHEVIQAVEEKLMSQIECCWAHHGISVKSFEKILVRAS